MKKLISCFILLIFPVRLSFWFLNLLGHAISSKAKVGFSLVLVDKLVMEAGSKIGHMNMIFCNAIYMKPKSYISRLNVIKGPIIVDLAIQGAIGNSNVITRAPIGVSYGESRLKLGLLSKITAKHRVDCMCNITFGDYTTLAGSGSQIWTHGYYHEKEGPGRYRIDGEIWLKDNVYIGSMCVFNPGVTIEDGITVGSGSSISKDLKERGLYVSQALRYIDSNAEKAKPKLNRVKGYNIEEEVYTKKENKA